MSDNQTFLKGQLLIATPAMGDPRFHHAVILICSHDSGGAMGLVLTNILPGVSFANMLDSFELSPAHKDFFTQIPVLGGGPVDSQRGFVLHKNHYQIKDTITINDDLAITGTMDALQQIVENKGPEPFIFALGYAGWTPGQLESEIAANAWLCVEPDNALVFDVSAAQKWQMALSKLGVDPGFLSAAAGHA